ncbi:MAG: hypothetical protein N2Z75_09565 [Meiothermus sp.]|nr:hypothetical protein [Meiothermus sp.]
MNRPQDELEHRYRIWLTYVRVYQSRLQDLRVRWWLERKEPRK